MHVIIVIFSTIMIRFLVMINIATTIHGVVKHMLYDHNFIKYWTKLFPIQSYISYVSILLYKNGLSYNKGLQIV